MEAYPGQDYFHAVNPNIRRAEENFEKKSKCWEWYGPVGETGYGKTTLRGYGFITAHRKMAVLWQGINPKEVLHVLHKCDNPLCVNPDHLFLGTNRDNQLDCVAKLRHPNTLKTHCSKGHLFCKENTYYVKRKGKTNIERSCRLCKNLRPYKKEDLTNE